MNDSRLTKASIARIFDVAESDLGDVENSVGVEEDREAFWKNEVRPQVERIETDLAERFDP